MTSEISACITTKHLPQWLSIRKTSAIHEHKCNGSGVRLCTWQQSADLHEGVGCLMNIKKS